ncbi:hypothetical protein Tco_1097248 [Tanacetum coccineum]
MRCPENLSQTLWKFRNTSSNGVFGSRNGVGIVVNHGGDGGIVVVTWRDKGVFGSLDPKSSPLLPPLSIEIEFVCVRYVLVCVSPGVLGVFIG